MKMEPIEGSETSAFGHFLVTTLSSINTTNIPTRVILPSPAYEDGTDRGFRNVGF